MNFTDNSHQNLSKAFILQIVHTNSKPVFAECYEFNRSYPSNNYFYSFFCVLRYYHVFGVSDKILRIVARVSRPSKKISQQ